MKATPVPKAEPFADSRDIWLGEIDGDKEQLCLKVSYHGTSSVAKATNDSKDDRHYNQRDNR